MKITKHKCIKDIYVDEKTTKTQIVVCRADSKYPVHFMVDTVGNVFSQVPERCWLKRTGENDQGKLFIGLQSRGPLMQSGMFFFPVEVKNGKSYPVKIKGIKTRNTEIVTYDGYIAVKNVFEFCPTNAFRGFNYFEMYSDKQLNALAELLSEKAKKHNIPTNYQGDSFWNINAKAMSGTPGIFNETAFSSTACYPYPEKRLVDILKSIK